MRLTRATLKTLRPGAKATWHFDDTLPGFGVKLQPSGAASWVVAFRIRGTAAKRTVTLGSIVVLSPEQARERGRAILAAAREGRDLQRETLAQAKAAAVEARARAKRINVKTGVDAYLAAIADRDSAQTGRPLSPASLAAARSRLAPLVARHGETPLADLPADHVTAVTEAISTKNRRNVHGTIARFLAWAKRAGHVTSVVTDSLDRPLPPPARTQTPSPTEVRTLLDTAERLVAEGRWVPVQRDVILLAFLTGQRRGELITADWGDIDLARALWTQPAAKNKARRLHILPLTDRIQAILCARHAAAGYPTHGLVLPPVRHSPTMLTNLAGLVATLRAETGITFRLHDARRALVSGLADLDIRFEVLDALLNHASSATRSGLRSVYNRASLIDGIRQALETWDSVIYSNIVPLRRSR